MNVGLLLLLQYSNRQNKRSLCILQRESHTTTRSQGSPGFKFAADAAVPARYEKGDGVHLTHPSNSYHPPILAIRSTMHTFSV